MLFRNGWQHVKMYFMCGLPTETDDDVLEAPITIEEMEEYAQHTGLGLTVLAGVDYARVLAEAERRGDVVLWDGGNNDTAFFRPDLQVTVLDPMRPDDGSGFHPGEVNVRSADVLALNKVNAAPPGAVAKATTRPPPSASCTCTSPVASRRFIRSSSRFWKRSSGDRFGM